MTQLPPPAAPLRVIVSLDVEEEGLFSGRYAATGCGVRNVALLRELAPLTQELGFPLTLFCAHTVFASAEARPHLAWLRDHYGAEIAAHLHHWSTPPLSEGPLADGPPPRTDTLPRPLLRARLHTLLQAGRDFQGAPLTSFRMGRWDCKAVLRPLLAAEGITLDSSVCPLRVFDHAGPDHFLARRIPIGRSPQQRRTALPGTPCSSPPLRRFPSSGPWRACGTGWAGAKRGRTISTSGAR